MNRALHWLRARTGVRVVSALAAALAVAVVLVVAGISLVLLLNKSLHDSYQASAEQQATLLGQRVAANFTGSGDAKRNSVDATGKRTDIVQVLTDYGDGSADPDSEVGSNGPQRDVQIIGSSDTLDGRPRMVDWLLAPGETRVVPSAVIELADGTSAEVTIVGKGFRATGRPITVVAAQQLKPVHDAVDTVAVMVTGGIPILVLVSGFFTYLFAGRALRPVEAIRRRVAGLTDRDLARRVPEPPARDEVGRLARTMNQMLSRLEDSQATQRRFVADASHELRSPLATVATGLELLGSDMREDSANLGTVQTLRGETTRLTNLVEGLLFLARADERGLAPRREEVDLDEIAENERVRPSTDDGVAVRVSTEPVRVVGDRGQMTRVVRNLVDNARWYADGTVAVSVRAEDDLAVIEIDDDGPGVPEADRARVFERFVRLDEARARGDGGSGLGLAIVAELVSAHGGTVTAAAASELGGARFRVTMPLAGSPGAFTVCETGSPGAGSPGAGPEPGAELGAGVDPGAGSLADRPDPPDARPSGPIPRVPMGARRRTPSPDPAATGTDEVPVSGPAGSTERSPDDDVTGGAAVPAPVSEQRPEEQPVPADPAGHDPHAASRPTEPDPPTGPLPIRPNTVGSPADENGTRPLPVVRPRPESGSSASPAGPRTGPDRAPVGASRGRPPGARPNGPPHNGPPQNDPSQNGVVRNGHPVGPGRNGHRNGAGPNGVRRNGHGPVDGQHGPPGEPRPRGSSGEDPWWGGQPPGP